MKQIQLHDRVFRMSIPEQEIDRAIQAVADKINADYKDSDSLPLFLSVLNGSFMFAAGLVKRIAFPCEISFVKLASYHGERSSGKATELIGISDALVGRDIIVVEDIVDTGNTYESLMATLMRHNPRSVKIAAMLLKPEVYQKTLPVDYVAMQIANDFIVGYGLDYNGLGRNLPDIYTMVRQK
ncbi:MAG: hypoxanthine phosphoribosyltransferase [Prevotellaceae bacterium]|jgi:hypoxanthine phosphoribosyltransferase|nr:hypoxanthine phosphoribosyltransferase [Prevotellaceae bacterium]